MKSEWTKERKEYMRELSLDYGGVPLETVMMLADMLGPNEDHDGLICELDDYSLGMDDEDLFAVLAAI